MLAMKVGEKMIIPCDECGYTTVRGYVCDMNFFENRKYRSHLDRAQRIYIVTRQS